MRAADVSVSQDVLKYKTDADIKEVIRLGIFTMFTFNTYYDPLTPQCKVADIIMSLLWIVSYLPEGMYYRSSTQYDVN